MTRNSLSHFWDRAAETWDSMVESERNPHYHYYRTTDLLVVKLLQATQAQQALELGCGTAGCAINALQILNNNADLHITGIDISPRMIELGKQKIEKIGLKNRITLNIGDCSSLPYPNEYFDVVFSRGGVLSYTEHPTHLLQSAYRVLRFGGALGLDVLPKYPKGRGYYIGKLAESLNDNGIPHSRSMQVSYREFFVKGNYQIVREYLVKSGSQLFMELTQEFHALPSHLPGILKRPQHLKEADFIFEKKVRLLTVEELRQTLMNAQFRDIRVYGEGYATYLVKDKELRPFVNAHRDYFSKAEILLYDKLCLDYAVMLYITGWKR
ncbi:MAG: class I SAM-dependent methyltransferase [Candidatus Hodarchaeota archaeon]